MADKGNLLIVDGYGLAYRAYYALHSRGFSAPDGTPTDVLLGFTNMLALAEERVLPSHRVAVFDAPAPTFRHELLREYKANRPPSPDDFKVQVPLLQELLGFMGCPVLMRAGVEADDVMASLALRAVQEGYHAVLLSSDKDLLQVLGDGVSMLRPLRNGVSEAETFDRAAFESKFRFPPALMADYLALLGDNSDNVPGVPGIGKVTASDLLAQWGGLEGVFDTLDELKPSIRRKLEAVGREKVLWTRDQLIRLKLDVPVDLEDCLRAQADLPAAMALASRLRLSKLLERLSSMAQGRQERRVRAPRVETGPVPQRMDDEVRALLPLGEGRYRVLSPDGGSVDGSRVEAEAALRGRRVLTVDYKALLAQDPGLLEGAELWDLRTAHYLLHPDAPVKAFSKLIPEGEDPGPALLALARELDPELLRHEGLAGVMEGIDLPLLPALDRMERWGVRLDPLRFSELQGELEGRIAAIEAEVAARGGEGVNLNSSQQVARLLFEQLGFTPEGRTKGKTGYSTAASVLEHLARLPGGEVPGLILEHRELSKMLSGFVVPFQQAAEGGGVIHTTFVASHTGTGRLSSRDPNLQNIPTFGHWADRIKEGLVPVREGDVFVAADYSQIELRVLAHLSQEPRLLTAFQEGRDIHRETAAWVFNVEPEFVTPELRRMAKTVNFGLLYGMSPFGLAERLEVSRGEAAAIVRRYFGALPEVQRFLDEIVAEARRAGFAWTEAGRIRPISEIPANGRPDLDRALINTPIQGTAADIARQALIGFDRAFASDAEVHLFLQVHDSLVCECPPHRAQEVGRALGEIMKDAARLSLPLEAEVKTGATLAEV